MDRTKRQSTRDSFHSDSRPTVVIVGDKVFDLVPSEWTVSKLKATSPKERPHARILNEIPVRTPEEQVKVNEEQTQVYELARSSRPLNTKVTSLKKAAQLGTNVPEEIERLLALKAKATPEEAKKIRKQLRRLDYKRYKQEKEGGE